MADEKRNSDDDSPRPPTPDDEEQQAEDEIREQQEQDERDERERRGTGLSGWLWQQRQQREGRETEGAARDVEASSLEEGWKLPKSETRLLPILSGLICPFSVLLDIPGITQRWYVRTEDHVVVETQPNPAWLDVSLAISLALGVLANLALIARFLEHRPRVYTWVSMVSLTIHDVLNTVVVIVFAVEHMADDGFTNGSAFWLTVASTATSVFCNITLALDLWRTKDFDKKGSGLTEKQRSLTIVTMVLLLYIGLGALIFHYLILDIDFISSLYFTICTITSVGFGDIVPITVGSRVFSYFYDPVGLVLIALTIALARECLIESFEESYRQRRDKLANKARERKEGWKKRHEEKEARRMRREKEAREQAAKGQRQEGGDGDGEGATPLQREAQKRKVSLAPTSGGSRRGSVGGLARTLKKVPSLLLPPFGSGAGETPSAAPPSTSPEPTSPAAADLPAHALFPSPSPTSPTSGTGAPASPSSAAPSSPRWRWLNPHRFRAPSSLFRSPSATPSSRPLTASPPADGPPTRGEEEGEGGAPFHRSTSSITTVSTVDDSFRTLKAQLAKEQKQEFRLKLGISIVLFLIFWLVGAAVFQATEKWTYFEGLWFGFVYFTTIGYGDLSPKSEAGRSFFVAWALFGIFNMTLLISVLTESFSSRYKSTISSGRVKKALRRVKPSAKRQAIIDNELLATEGYHPLHGRVGDAVPQGEGKKRRGGSSGKATPIPPEELPEKIVETIKGFHEHARYFMLGRTGVPPASLRFLLDAAEADELDERLPEVVKGGPTSLADVGKQGDMKQYLFLVAYERQFDTLLEAADQLSSFLSSQRDELSSLRVEKEELQARLGEGSEKSDADEEEAGDEEEEAGDEEEETERSAFGARFVKRPPGGYGDERVEEDMVREVDEDDEGEGGEEEEQGNRRGSSSSSVPQRPQHDRRRSSLTTGDIFPSLNLTTSPSPASPSSPSPSTVPATASPPRRERRSLHLPHLHLAHSHHQPRSGLEGEEGRRRSSLSFRLPEGHEERAEGVPERDLGEGMGDT
ncbi:hypothetical protein JCM6882_003860 [Rhodosporidiobolus microsporus]